MFKQRFLKFGLIISLLLHVVYFYLLIPRKTYEQKKEVFIDLVPEMVPPPQQIVESPQSNNQVSDAKLLSEQDNKVEKQTKKNGDSPNQTVKTPAPQKKAEPPAKEKPAEKNEFSENTKPRKPETKPEKKINLFDSSIMTQKAGTQDKLDDIPSGEITLLNSKANKFAGFVRRIATSVFSDIKSNYIPLLESRVPLSSNGSIEFKTILNKSGQQISNEVQNSDLDNTIRQIVTAAIKEYANDPNPPEGALSSHGTYDLVFEFHTKRTGSVISFELGVGLD